MKRAVTQEEAKRILSEAAAGVLSMITPEGFPYGVMIHHVYLPQENCVFFHCAKVGKKLDCIAANPQVSLFVAASQQMIPDRYTTHYASAIVTGKAVFVTEEREKREKLQLLCDRFSPGEARQEEVIQKYWNTVAICKINIDTITGKQNREL